MRVVLEAEAVNALLDPRHPAERKVCAIASVVTGVLALAKAPDGGNAAELRGARAEIG